MDRWESKRQYGDEPWLPIWSSKKLFPLMVSDVVRDCEIAMDSWVDDWREEPEAAVTSLSVV